jgi:predicted transcriptional regulator
MKRIFDELEDQGRVGSSGGVASLSKQSVVQKIKGSKREIESPTQSLLEKTTDAFIQGEKNRTAQILASYKDIPGNPFQLEPLRTAANVEKRIGILRELRDTYRGVDGEFDGIKSERRQLQTANRRVRGVLSQENKVKRELENLLDTALGRAADFDAKSHLDSLISKLSTLEKRQNDLNEKAFFGKEAERAKELTKILEEKKSIVNGLREELSKARDIPKDPGEHTISFFRNGVKETWKTSKEIAEAAKALNVEQMNIVGKLFAAPVRALKLGATGVNPAFIASNVVRDQLSSFVNSKNGLRASVLNPKNFAESLWSVLGHGKDYQEMVRQGAMQTSFDIGRSQVIPTVRNIRGLRTPGLLEKGKYIASTPARLFRAAEDLIGRSEEFTRVQQFNAARDAALAKGMPMEDALAVGARAARETSTNFARKGEFGTVINNTIPYLNAGIQGTRTNLRNLKERPLLTGSKLVLALGFPVAAATAYNLKNKDTREAYEDIPEYEKEKNIIIIPPNPTKNEDGEWEVIKIPITPGHANMVQAGRYAVERMFGLGEQKFGKIASTLLGSVTPVEPTPKGAISGLTPQAIKPSAEALMNKNMYTGFDIVPKRLQDLPPEEQYKEGTSATARIIGDKLGVSPIKTQAFTQGTFAEVGLNALNASDQVLAKAGMIDKEQIGARSIPESMSRRFTTAAGGEQDNRRYELQAEGEQMKKTENLEKKRGIEPVYNEVKELVKQGRHDEAQAKVDALNDEEYKTFKKIGTAEKTKNTSTFKNLMEVNPKEAAKYGASLGEDEYQRIIDNLDDDEYEEFLRASQ